MQRPVQDSNLATALEGGVGGKASQSPAGLLRGFSSLAHPPIPLNWWGGETGQLTARHEGAKEVRLEGAAFLRKAPAHPSTNGAKGTGRDP